MLATPPVRKKQNSNSSCDLSEILKYPEAKPTSKKKPGMNSLYSVSKRLTGT